MDFNDYWQENKRFVMTVASGGVVFLIGNMFLSSNYEGDIQAARRNKIHVQSELGKTWFSNSDLDSVEEQNRALRAAVERLAAHVNFEARPAFRVESGGLSPASQYLRAHQAVKDDLIPRANRANLKLDEGLGMPDLSPTREDEIVRMLEALDVIDTVINLAIQAGVSRVDKITVKLDNRLSTRQGVGRIERTSVRFLFEGPARPITRLLAMSQRTADQRALVIDEMEMTAKRQKLGHADLDLTLVVIRLHEPEEAQP